MTAYPAALRRARSSSRSPATTTSSSGRRCLARRSTDVAAAVREALAFPLAGPAAREARHARRHRDGRDRAAVAPDPGGAASARATSRSPPSVDELERLGVAQVTILVAGGLLRRTTPARDRAARPARVPAPLQGTRDRARRGGRGPRRARARRATCRCASTRRSSRPISSSTVTAAETVLHGGPAALLAASGREALRAAGALSLLETSASQGWRLAVEIERAARQRGAGHRRLARPEPAARRRPARGLPARPGGDRADRSRSRVRRAVPARADGDAAADARAAAARADGGRRRTAARRRSRTPRRCCAARVFKGVELDEPVDAIVIGIPPTTPFMPRERPNPVSAAYLGLGLALRLWRNAPPIAPGRHGDPRPSASAPLPAADADAVPRAVLRPAHGARHRRDARRRGGGGRRPRAIADYRAGRACHPLQPFVEWSACDARPPPARRRR